MRRNRALFLAGFLVYAFTTLSVLRQHDQQPFVAGGTYMDDNDNDVSSPSLFLVHVGKTGGSTVEGILSIACQARKPGPNQDMCWDQFWDKHKIRQTQPATGTSNNSSTKKQDATIPESHLSQLTKGFLHVDWTFPDAQTLHDATAFVVTLRSPMDRVASWFYFLHPNNCYTDEHGTAVPRTPDSLIDKACITRRRADKNNHTFEFEFYRVCFPTMNDFAWHVLPGGNTNGNAYNNNNNNNQMPDCPRLARETLAGRGGPNGMAGHLFANYQYYADRTTRQFPSKHVYAVRTQYLWQDLAAVDRAVGGTGQLFQELQELHPTQVNAKQYYRGKDNDENNPVQQRIEQEQSEENPQPQDQQQPARRNVYQKDPLSPSGYQQLCCALQDEIAVYYELLQKARNLQPRQVQETMQEVWSQCSGGGTNVTLDSLEELVDHCAPLSPAWKGR